MLGAGQVGRLDVVALLDLLGLDLQVLLALEAVDVDAQRRALGT